MSEWKCLRKKSERADFGSISAQSKSSTRLSVIEFSAHWPSSHILDSCICPGHNHHDGCQVRASGIKLRAVRYHLCSQLLCWPLYPLCRWPPHHLPPSPSLPPFCLHPFLFLLLVSFTDQPPFFLLHSAPFCSPRILSHYSMLPLPSPCPHVQTSVCLYLLSRLRSLPWLPLCLFIPPPPHALGLLVTLSLVPWKLLLFLPPCLFGHHLLPLLSLQIYEYRNGHQEVESPFQGRLQWNGSKDLQDVSITVLNVTLNDSGLYTCNVSREFEFEAHRPFVKTTRLIPLRVTEEGKTGAQSLFRGWGGGQ